VNDFFVIEPCQSAKGIEIRLKGKRIDLKKAEAALAGLGEVVGSSPVVLLVKMKGLSLSIYASGRMMVKGNVRPGSKRAEALARRLVGALEKNGAII
jgi:hypothetical protein